MPIPGRLQLQTLIRIRPAASTADPYGTTWDYGSAAAHSTISGWLDFPSSSETFSDGRDILEQRPLLITNTTDIDANDRIQWAGHPDGQTRIFAVNGPPQVKYTPRGPNHLEAELRKVEG